MNAFELFTLVSNQNFKLKSTHNFPRETLLIILLKRGGTHKASWVLLRTVSLGFKSRNQDPGDHTKHCYSTCLISFSEHVEVIIGWMEKGTRRPEAVLENKSKWYMCHLESCTVPRVETRFQYWAACSAAAGTTGSSCSPEANCLYCPGSMGGCKVLVSWSASLLDLSKLCELPHMSSTAVFILFIYPCVYNNKTVLSEDLKNSSAVVPSLFPPPC